MGAPFADSSDVAARWRPLTAAEQSVADTLCGDASAVIRSRFPGIDGQVTSGAVDPDSLTIVVAGMVKRAMKAPDDGVASEAQTVGPFSRSQSYANPLGNVFLTAADLVLILGYRPAGMSAGFSNTTTNVENCGPGFVYGLGY